MVVCQLLLPSSIWLFLVAWSSSSAGISAAFFFANSPAAYYSNNQCAITRQLLGGGPPIAETFHHHVCSKRTNDSSNFSKCPSTILLSKSSFRNKPPIIIGYSSRRVSWSKLKTLGDASPQDGEHDDCSEEEEEEEEVKHVSQENSSRMTKRQKYIIKPVRKAMEKFKSKPGTYMLIPCIAAIVGWFTNWLAVQMIFYPIQFRGIPLVIKEEVPLGLIGWQGIVPCKTRKMSETMVTMVTTQLLSVQEVFRRLEPQKLADLLAPEVPKLGQSIVEDMLPNTSWGSALANLPRAVFVGLPSYTKDIIQKMNHNFLKDFVIAMQDNIDSLLNVRNCVVNQMLMDRTMLGTLFQKCGKKELEFLTNSGLWFGFLLGLIQMMVALFWENPWSLSIGGGIVGLATNWLALKWIFEPVNPTKVGPFILQGQFLRRQKEVAAEFSSYFASNILTSEKMFHSILTDPTTSPAFSELFSRHFIKFAAAVTSGLRILPEAQVLQVAAKRAVEKLPNHIGVLHSYVDEKLQLQETLRISMEGMTSAQFERVLHPIFEEDELTLILAGAALGFAAGLVQQGLETGSIKIPNLKKSLSWITTKLPSRLCSMRHAIGFRIKRRFSKRRQ